MNLSHVFHTIRWMKPRQMAWQVVHRVRRLLPALGSRLRKFDKSDVKWTPRASEFGRGMPPADTGDFERGRFTFQNDLREIGQPPNWMPDAPLLWVYHLHYFEYIWSLPFVDARSSVLYWITDHNPSNIHVGWEPYPTSLRLQNWCSYFLGTHIAATNADPAFRDQLIRSIETQAAWLNNRIEYHLLGNHLLENAGTLSLVGACLSGDHARSLAVRGQHILKVQLQEQFLADGGHFERSPMYHARATYLLSQLSASGSRELEALVDQPLNAARSALGDMTHPDGDIALLNDSALGMAPQHAALSAPARIGTFALPDTGYFGDRTARGDYLICDAGPIGPDYIPGHAHGDIFSYELSLDRARIVVDSGVFGYLADDMREYCRSTRAHNTVEVGGEDQCEFWAAFRVARRGHPFDVTFEETAQGFRLSGSHDGYRRLSGQPIHRRSFVWHRDGVLVVRDRVDASKSVTSCSYIHFHPDCHIELIDTRTACITLDGVEVYVAWFGPGTLRIDPSWYCREFGIRIANESLVFETDGSFFGYCLSRSSTPATHELDGRACVGDKYYG